MTSSKKAPRFAEGTTVPVARTQGELRELLTRHGAAQIVISEDAARVVLMFKMKARVARLMFEQPRPEAFGGYVPRRGYRTDAQKRAACEAELRRRWRVLLLRLKARLEVIASEDSTFDAEFLADLVVEGGRTVGELVTPQLEGATAAGGLRILPEPGDRT